jgi:phosphotransferase system  glucose/maltose/N-acetylglucosamine-specific IIC component
MTSNVNQRAVAAFRKGKYGVSSGFTISAVLILYVIISPSRGPLLPDYSLGSITFFIIGIILPALLGAGISGFIIEAIIIRKWIFRNNHLQQYKKGSISGTILCGILALPFALFISVIFSGWGGSLGNAIGELFHDPDTGFLLGLAFFGIIIPPVIVTAVSSLGTILGYSVQLIFRCITSMRNKSTKI